MAWRIGLWSLQCRTGRLTLFDGMLKQPHARPCCSQLPSAVPAVYPVVYSSNPWANCGGRLQASTSKHCSIYLPVCTRPCSVVGRPATQHVPPCKQGRRSARLQLLPGAGNEQQETDRWVWRPAAGRQLPPPPPPPRDSRRYSSREGLRGVTTTCSPTLSAVRRPRLSLVHAQQGGGSSPPPSQQQQDDERRLEALEAAARARKGVKADQAEAFRGSRPASVSVRRMSAVAGAFDAMPAASSIVGCPDLLICWSPGCCRAGLLQQRRHARLEGGPAVPRG